MLLFYFYFPGSLIVLDMVQMKDFSVCGGITVRVAEIKPTMYTVFLAHTTLADNSHEVF